MLLAARQLVPASQAGEKAESILFQKPMPTGKYLYDLNQLLKSHGLDLHVTEADLLVSDNVVTDAYSPDRPISSGLSAMVSPPIHRGEFYHYTRGEVATKIMESGLLRLTSVKKRLAQAEISGFLKRFGFDYPLGTEPGSITPRYTISIASEVFYTSFTDTSLSKGEEEYFWNEFAGATGARLKFRLSVGSGCLRRMVYGDQIDRCAKLYREISDLTKRSLGKIFFWDDAATVCALHLPSTLDIEKETRLIIRRAWGLPLGIDGGYEFLEAKIGDNSSLALRIDLMEIQTNNPTPNPRGANVILRPPSV